MSRGPGRVQRYIRGHLAALKGDWCPAPDLAAAYAIAVGIPLDCGAAGGYISAPYRTRRDRLSRPSTAR